MLTLNHLNLPVHDVPAAQAFLETYFGMRTEFAIGANFMAMMNDAGTMRLNLSHFRKLETDPVVYPQDFHIGFFLAEVAAVDAVRARMAGGGLPPGVPSTPSSDTPSTSHRPAASRSKWAVPNSAMPTHFAFSAACSSSSGPSGSSRGWASSRPSRAS